MSNVNTYLFLFFSVIASGGLFLLLNIKALWMKLLLAFSGAYLFAVSVVHLMPETYEHGGASVGIFILAGFIIQLLLEFFSEGIEHGHIHVHKHHGHAHFPWGALAGLSLHSFLEGMPLAYSASAVTTQQQSLLTGIILHNIPISFALMSMLLQSGIKKSTAFITLITFALVTPLGTFIAAVGGNYLQNGFEEYRLRIMAIVIGIFLHISTTILFESSENHRFNLMKFATIIAGVLLAVGLMR